MALSALVAITVVDPSNPTEVQAWLSNNPLAVVTTIFIANNVFYIVHT